MIVNRGRGLLSTVLRATLNTTKDTDDGHIIALGVQGMLPWKRWSSRINITSQWLLSFHQKSSNDTPIRANTRLSAFRFTHTTNLKIMHVKCVHLTHTPYKQAHTNMLCLSHFKASVRDDDAQDPQRFVSSHVGSFMLFNTLLTTFSRSFLALCSSSSDLFIFLLSCEVK